MKRERGYIYLITDKNNVDIYTGVTCNLVKPTFDHKEDLAEGFTNNYNFKKLVYYEILEDSKAAIA